MQMRIKMVFLGSRILLIYFKFKFIIHYFFKARCRVGFH